MSHPHFSWQDVAQSGRGAESGNGGKRRVFSGGPMSYTVSGVADSANPAIDVGDFTLHVKVSQGYVTAVVQWPVYIRQQTVQQYDIG